MAAYTVYKASNSTATKKCVKEVFLTFTRNKNSRYLGYYWRHLSTPVFRRRQLVYRQNVLKALEEIPSLKERLKAINAPDPILDAKIDIGFIPKAKTKVPVKERLEWHKKISKVATAIDGEITKIDLSQLQKVWLENEGCSHVQNVADHYGIYKDLFDHGVFTPCVPLDIAYEFDENLENPVHMGNILQASDVSKEPTVNYSSGSNDLWTLVLSNLDGHLLDTHSEYLHWFVGNIPGNQLKSGEIICDYLQPFPMRGTGYHRLVFVLYKQDKKIDFSSLKKTSPCFSLKERTFKTFDFYKQYQDFITPAGLAFYQCTWDQSLTDFFHNVLNMQEPVFEYIEPPVYHKPQVHYPHLEFFNLYLDRYRDPKEIKKEVLLKRLQMVEPFKDEKPMPKYPCLHKPEDYKFSWQQQDIRLRRLRLGKYRDLRPASVYPEEDNQFPYWNKA